MMPGRPFGAITRPTELANWVMMGNNQKGKSTLIVEGTSDSNVFLLMVESKCCRIIIAEGKDNVLAAMAIVRKKSYPGVMAVVDADFDHVENAVLAFDDVGVTDTHDVETMILSTPVFQKVLARNGFSQLGRREVTAEEFERSAAELLQRLFSVGLRLGYLRWASNRHGLKIRFEAFDHSRVVDASTLIIREDRLEDEVLRASTLEAGTWLEIKRRADSLVDAGHDPWQICCGHDLTSLLAIHLSRVTGTPIKRKAIEADLSLGYGFDQFQRTRLYRTMSEWEQRNAPRYILKRN